MFKLSTMICFISSDLVSISRRTGQVLWTESVIMTSSWKYGTLLSRQGSVLCNPMETLVSGIFVVQRPFGHLFGTLLLF